MSMNHLKQLNCLKIQAFPLVMLVGKLSYNYKRCLHILRMCIANNYLKCWDVKQGSEGQLNKVFYLNRWICVKFKLPLSYGGWKPISQQELYDMIISGEE